jgi:hypothetical protein
LYSYTIIAALLVFSFGLTSAYADETFVNSDNLSFNHVPDSLLPRHVSLAIDPLTGEESPMLSDRSYVQVSGNIYDITDQIDPGSLQSTVTIEGQTFGIKLDTFDRTANILAILLLAVPFGLLVYRMSDNDPIPLKYAKLSGVAVFFAMASMLTMPITIGNSFWGYASATESEPNMPEPIDYLYFDTGNNYLSHGASIILDAENSAVSLDGNNDYLVLSSNLPEKLNEFTVSAWVQPDYKKGVPATLSIVSEADAFDLSINNDKVEKNIAVFSVYDGIKWHVVQSKSAILEQWTHISATYSGNEIKIFVNGVQEGSQRIDGDYSLTHNAGGVSTQNSYDYLSLQSNLLIGAFNPSIRDSTSVQNHFSGLIDDVTLYDKLLSSDNISALDNNNRTPDVTPESEVQQSETTVEQTGTENEYGFTTADDNPNDQKIEEEAYKGYKVKKPEETKKKDKANQASEKAKEALEENPSAADQSTEETIDDTTEETTDDTTEETTDEITEEN